MNREQAIKQEQKRLQDLKQAYERIPALVWQDLWAQFCGISFDANPHITSFKEGRRQIVHYMLGMADKLNFEGMEALWKRTKSKL